ncbi:MAG: hypothetical protein ABSA02_32095 [Trebonia sp.]
MPDRARALATMAAALRPGGWLLVEDADIDAHLAAIHAGKLDLTLAPLISAWGRRPAEHPPALG